MSATILVGFTEPSAGAMRPLQTPLLRALARGASYKTPQDRNGESRALTLEGRALALAELAHRRKVRALVNRLDQLQPTKVGVKLADQMLHHFYDGTPTKTIGNAKARQIEVLCSLLSRLGPAYKRIQENGCNRDLRSWERMREAQIEARARVICDAFPPTTSGKRVSAVFQGDPRGYTLRVKVPDAPRDGNTWGHGGEYGVHSS